MSKKRSEILIFKTALHMGSCIKVVKQKNVPFSVIIDAFAKLKTHSRSVGNCFAISSCAYALALTFEQTNTLSPSPKGFQISDFLPDFQPPNMIFLSEKMSHFLS
jgi:hypothetical protein